VSTYEEREALNAARFRRYEQMAILLSCLPEAPESDSESNAELFDELAADGLLEVTTETDDVAWHQTTPEGREALLAYVRGER
jgi:hypothetical protein